MKPFPDEHRTATPAWLETWADLFVTHIEAYAVFAVDLQGTLLTWQTGVEKVMGHSRETFVGQPLAMLFTESDRQAGVPERELDTARAAGQALDERWHLRADGSRFWGSGILLALRNAEGEVVGFSKIVRDRTAARLRRESLSLQTLRLEGDVLTRTEQVRALASDLALAEQRERGRISQLLHDELQQQLYALQLAAYNALAYAAEEPLADTLRDIYVLSKLGLATTRTLVSELSPAVLASGDLGAALHWLAEHMHERHGLAVKLTGVQGCPQLTEALSIVLFQCVRELLFNVVKHARVGSEVSRAVGSGTEPAPRLDAEVSAGINVRVHAERLQLEVWDEGAGFKVATETLNDLSGFGDKFGLASVKRRLEPFGGVMLLASVPGAGTRVTLEVALHGRF